MHELTEKQLKRRENRLRSKEEKLRKEEEARQQALILKQKTDEKFMKQALLQAKKAKELGEVPIGCVIVQDGKVIGRGYNRRNTDKSTLSHAEITAIRKASKKLNDWRLEECTLYVTLEPCCHYGKTPPCTEAIVENKIARVVIGSRDPNPLVAGKGVRFLREHGIEVIEDYLREECDRINPVFFHYITTKMPYVVLKYAMTADGKTATVTGDSKWITNDASRMKVQHMRHRYMGIMAGIGTVLADDPMLNVRVERLKSPIRIICDSNLRIPLDSQIVKSADKYKTIVACVHTDDEKIAKLQERGVSVEVIPSEREVDMTCLMQRLGQLGIDSVLVEGGGTLNDSLLQANLINQVDVFIGSKIFGGAKAKSPMEGTGIEKVKDAPEFYLDGIERIEDDVLLTYMKRR